MFQVLRRDEARVLHEMLESMRDLRRFGMLRPGELYRVKRMLWEAGGRIPLAQRKGRLRSPRMPASRQQLQANGRAFSLRYPYRSVRASSAPRFTLANGCVTAHPTGRLGVKPWPRTCNAGVRRNGSRSTTRTRGGTRLTATTWCSATRSSAWRTLTHGKGSPLRSPVTSEGMFHAHRRRTDIEIAYVRSIVVPGVSCRCVHD